MSDPEFQKESIKTISGAVTRMERIIEKLKSPPEKEQLQISSVDPLTVINKAVEKSGIPNKIGIELIVENDEMIPVRSDPAVLETVFINLMINAIEAMPEGGRITLKQQITDDEKSVILVTDTGIGMPSSFIENQLFRPFVTTKTKGLGIGLYQCREMFREAGGDLMATSEPGRGTTFTLSFP
jgi:signal transduction histidine kinase